MTTTQPRVECLELKPGDEVEITVGFYAGKHAQIVEIGYGMAELRVDWKRAPLWKSITDLRKVEK